ncbi:hypothetical protein JCM8097_009229 [Rhodosporidiobolus ruineniae]
MQALIVAALVASTAAAHSIPLVERAASSSSYPPVGQKGPTPKAEWVATYNAAKAAGKIPSFAPSTLVNGQPAYAKGVNTGKNGVCSWSVSHCFGDNDIYEAPDGMYAISFDDGPLPSSPPLYKFLQSQNQTATHFFIGTNILQNQDVFKQALASGGQIGVHTWTHPYMTTLTDMQILGELGWTAQVIYDLSGFAPAWWRPPYGDTDDRVRAIAEQVFGLKLASWDRDSSDWCLNEAGGSSCVGSGPSSQADLEAELRGWQVGTKSPGVLALEHELTSHSVGAFINTYAGIKQHGWDPRCVPDLNGEVWYQNAQRNEQPRGTVAIGSGSFNVGNVAAASSASSAPASSASSASSSSAANLTSTAVSSVYTTTRLPTPTSYGQTVTAQPQVVSASPSTTNAGGRSFQLEGGLVAFFLGTAAFLA